MKNYLVISFTIKGPSNIQALKKSLDLFEITHDLVVKDSLKGKNYSFSQAAFIKNMLKKHAPTPVVWMDPNIEITRPPIQFDVQSTLVAIYSNDITTKIDSGVIYVRNHPGTQQLMDMWIDNNKNNPEAWESENLRAAICQWHKKFIGEVGMIPETYSPYTPNVINRLIKKGVSHA